MIPPGIYRRRLTSKSDGKCQFVPARNGGECFEGVLEVFMEFFSIKLKRLHKDGIHLQLSTTTNLTAVSVHSGVGYLKQF